MKSRWFSRASFIAVALVSATAVAACGRAQTTADEAPQEAETAQSESPAGAQHTPGARIFRQIDALDLTADQRDELRDIEATFTEGLSVHRAALHEVAETLARGLEAGTLDTAAAERNQESLQRAAAAARASIITAMNDVHSVLDADQREELILSLRAQREERREHGGEARGERRHAGMASLAAQIGLDDHQTRAIRDQVEAQIDKAFPERKAKREAWEAKRAALEDAFMSDDFDAAGMDLGHDAEEHIASFTSTARQAIDFAGGLLDPVQRQLAASLLRSRAASL